MKKDSKPTISARNFLLVIFDAATTNFQRAMGLDRKIGFFISTGFELPICSDPRCHKLGNKTFFWVNGFFVSTVGLDEKQIRRYVRRQLHKDKKAEQVKLWRN